MLKTSHLHLWFVSLWQAVWAGWGHASENHKLPELLHKNSIQFIGNWTVTDKSYIMSASEHKFILPVFDKIVWASIDMMRFGKSGATGKENVGSKATR